MTREEAKDYIREWCPYDRQEEIIKALEQEPCEMTAEEYRQRMIQAFHNADCDELIALVVLPTEKEFEHLAWLLEKHYKAKPEPVQVELEGDGYYDALQKQSESEVSDSE